MNKTSLTALLSITILTSVIAISDISPAFATFGINPDNEHYYEFITTNNIKWTDAKAAAESRTYNGVSGHLVTITSQSENDFVNGILPDSSRVWIGLTDKGREGEYKWVTGEPYFYSNWASGQPTGDNEDYVEMYGWNDKWNDNTNWNSYESVTGYVVEYDDVLVHNPANGHFYQYVKDHDISWTEAKAAAESHKFNGVNGHLVTTTTSNEVLFLLDLVPNDFRSWIGLTDKDIEGTYTWVTGEPFIFSKWDVNQPDNSNNEDYVEFLESRERWNDLPNDYNNIDGYIIEYTTPPILNPENGHYYKYIHDPYNTWTNAKAAAESHKFNGVNGHLVTITSQIENDFVSELVPDNYIFTWIGLSDETTEGTYQWVTGETFNYTNWDTDQPDNFGGNEDYIQFRGYSDKWNDIKNDADYINGYIIEYDIPHLNPENSHYYEFVTDYNISWTDAKTAAENSTFNGTSGHLVTIANKSENSFVSDLVPDNLSVWIGLTDIITEGQYKWVTGEPFGYSNWNTGQPSAGIGEHFAGFLSNGKWNDHRLYSSINVGYVIEYSD